ncbi:MAG TPA: thiamine phosphate synthase [Gammaproteobacteria bacterium]|nr:thiamine phosphate synthase [Gammaproteobacteria bacterium]
MSLNKLQGLYAITDTALIGGDKLLPAVAAALWGGARLVQYRDKTASQATRLQEANNLRALCHEHEARLIINDDIALAKASGADGVHLGQDDATVEQARCLLGRNAIIGVSCYNDFTLAQTANQEGADYIAFGSFFASNIKPGAPRAHTQLLVRAKQELSLPVCAIGGITPANGEDLVNAGADMLAVIHGLFNALDIEQAAQHYAALFAT